MEPWQRYFIVDTSVTAVRGLRFGRGFIGFQEDGTAFFGHKPENVKLYETQEAAMVDFNKIPDRVAIYHIIINQIPHPQNPQHMMAQVAHNKVATK
jgi:hypothetical protein